MAKVFIQDVRRLIALVVAALVALAAATSLLARFYHHEQRVRAQDHLEAGRRLMVEGSTAEAVADFRASLALDRDNPEAARLLAQALLTVGRIDEAHSYLSDLLRRFPVDGRLNRDMARVFVARERPGGARPYFQRAIYGEWPDDPLERRLETRFELIEYLRRIDEPQERVAELLLLTADVPPERVGTMRRLASLLLEVHQVTQAIEVLQAAAAAAPEDVGLLAQLAETQLSAGLMVESRATFRTALALQPDSRELRDQITLINRVLALDPTLPRLRLVERTQRARAVLAAVVQQVTACEAVDAEERDTLRNRATPLLQRGVRDAEAAEDALRLAVDVWAAAPACHNGSPEARAITRVLQVVALSQDTTP